MKRTLNSGFRPIRIVRWDENRAPGFELDFSDIHRARAFLAQFMGDPWDMHTLRSVLADEDTSAQHSPLSNREVLQRLAGHVASRRIRLTVRQETLQALPGGLAHGASQPDAPAEEPEAPPVATKTWIRIQVVHDATDTPIPDIVLHVTLPDGTSSTHTTGAEGWFEILDIDPGTCDVACTLEGARLRDTYAFVTLGDTPSTGAGTASGAPSSSVETNGERPPTRTRIARIDAHKVRTGESIKSIAEANGMTWQELSRFNWDTDVPDEINEHLRDEVGCTKKTPDGYNYSFDDADDPGLLFIPHPWTQTGLATEQTHTIRVKAADGFWIILENDEALRIPEARYEATLADGSTRQGLLGLSGIALIKDPPPGRIEIVFPDLDDVEAKSLAACARQAIDDGEYIRMSRLLKHAPEMIERAIAAYDRYFNTYTGNGFIEDLNQLFTDPLAWMAFKGLLALGQVETFAKEEHDG